MTALCRAISVPQKLLSSSVAVVMTILPLPCLGLQGIL